MRKTFSLAVVVVAIALIAMKQANKKVIFFGDSITQAGVQPKGYVALIKNELAKVDKEVIGAGIGGNKVYDLYLRLEDDVLVKKPSTVVIYVGINDVWHKKHGTGTDYDKFIKFYQALINKLKANNATVVVCTPTVIGEKKSGTNEMDADLEKYSGAIRELAAKNQLKVCDLRKIFAEHIAKNNPEDKAKDILTTDGVHLNDAGNKLVAESLLPLLK